MTDPKDVERAGHAAITVLRKMRSQGPITPVERTLVKHAIEAMDLEFLRVAMTEVAVEMQEKGVNLRDPSEWTWEQREQVFHMLETALTITGFNRWKAAAMMHISPTSLVDSWMRSPEWSQFISDPGRIHPMVATLERVAVQHAMEVMTSPAISPADEKRKARMAEHVLEHRRQATIAKGKLDFVEAQIRLKQTPAAAPELPPSPEPEEPATVEEEAPDFTPRRAVFDGDDAT